MREEFIVDGNRIYFKGKEVGWLHISASTGSVKSQITIGRSRQVVMSEKIDSVCADLSRAWSNASSNHDD